MDIKDKIAKLLAKAEGTDNEHEREAYTAQAERLMLKWGIKAADLEARGEIKPEPVIQDKRVFQTTYAIGWVKFGHSVASGMGNLRTLQSGAKSRYWLWCIGHTTDVSNYWVLMESLQAQCENALKQWWKDAPERQWGLSQREIYKCKRNFILAYGARVGARLADLRHEIQQDATPEAALVLVNKQERVNSWLDENVKYKSGVNRMNAGISGSRAGAEAGQRANLGRSVGSPSTGELA